MALIEKIEKAPNTDLLEPAPLKIGRWPVKPFTLQTFIVLEALDSPLVRPFETDENGTIKKDDAGKPIPRGFSMTDTATALWAFINWNRPDVMMILRDEKVLQNSIAALASEITMADVPKIQQDLNDVFAAVNSAMSASGLKEEGGGEKKDA